MITTVLLIAGVFSFIALFGFLLLLAYGLFFNEEVLESFIDKYGKRFNLD